MSYWYAAEGWLHGLEMMVVCAGLGRREFVNEVYRYEIGYQIWVRSDQIVTDPMCAL
jgi:hypothetical protein